MEAAQQFYLKMNLHIELHSMKGREQVIKINVAKITVTHGHDSLFL